MIASRSTSPPLSTSARCSEPRWRAWGTISAGLGSGKSFLIASYSSRLRCGERSRQCDRESGLEYGEDGSQGSYHTPKLGEENTIPVPVLEPTLPPSDQENIPPRMVTPPPLNFLVPVPEEEETRVKVCCQRTLVVCNQRAIRGRGAITKPYKCPARMQLASVSKIITTLLSGPLYP